MMISVVIPTYNLLEDCIKALSPDVQKPACKYEVIVSDDKIPSMAKPMLEKKYPWAIWVEGKHKGVAANRNNGVSYAQGDWIVFIDNDCIPDSNLINSYIKAIKDNPEILAFEGRISADRPKRHFLEEAPVNETGGYFWTCNVMINKNYFENTLHGFDENFYMYLEDTDIRMRIIKSGKPILFLRNAFVIHPWRLQNKPVEIAVQKEYSFNYLCYKHPEIQQHETLKHKLINELRFYIKNVLLQLIPFKCGGVLLYVKAHVASRQLKRKMLTANFHHQHNWSQLYS